LLSNSLWFDRSKSGFLNVYPVLAGLGLSLLASGLGGPRQFWRELTVLFFLGIPRGIAISHVDLALITARVATFWLWYLGQDVKVEGNEISLPGGSVNVVKSCDGTSAISSLLCLAVVFLVFFRPSRVRAVLTPVAAVSLAFLTNSFRIALLAVALAVGKQETFKYWHEGKGSVVWSLLPVLLFGTFCLFLTRRPTPVPSNPPGGEVP
jgi:cyanoexosortase A